MNLIAVEYEGSVFYINPEHIIFINKKYGGTCIHLDNRKELLVREDLESVKCQLYSQNEPLHAFKTDEDYLSN